MQLRRRTHVRTLDDADRPAVAELLAADPLGTVFLSGRIQSFGLSQWRLGCPVWGLFRGRDLVAVCHSGANLVPVGPVDDLVVESFATQTGGSRRCGSIVGRAELAMKLFSSLARRFPRAYSNPREVRPSQPLMVLDGPPTIAADPRVRRIRASELEIYFQAALKMYIEEVGVDPTKGSGGHHYRAHIAAIIDRGHAFGIIEDGRVLFKSDVGAAAGPIAQIQGVWLAPELRGQGLAAPAMAGVCELVRERFERVSLYVNDFNQPARATYRRTGFTEQGELATVLY